MKWGVHFISILLLLIPLSKFIPLDLGFIIFALIGSLAPDMIEASLRFEHRCKYLHNFIIVFLLFPFLIYSPIAGFSLGYFHHLLLDSLTKKGVYLGNIRLSNGFKTNDIFSNLAILSIHIFIVFLFIPLKIA
jgi:hypothetical protein